MSIFVLERTPAEKMQFYIQQIRNLKPVIVCCFAVILACAFASAAFADGAEKKRGLIVVFLYDESCKESCLVVRPVVRDVTRQRSDRIEYVELNTSPTAIKETTGKAASLKIKTFVDDRTDQVPLIAIFSTAGSAKPRLIKELVGKKTKDVYKEAVEKALEKVGAP